VSVAFDNAASRAPRPARNNERPEAFPVVAGLVASQFSHPADTPLTGPHRSSPAAVPEQRDFFEDMELDPGIAVARREGQWGSRRASKPQSRARQLKTPRHNRASPPSRRGHASDRDGVRAEGMRMIAGKRRDRQLGWSGALRGQPPNWTTNARWQNTSPSAFRTDALAYSDRSRMGQLLRTVVGPQSACTTIQATKFQLYLCFKFERNA
jgi:hypothetical protein